MSARRDKASGGPYRARDGMILGVCKGLARHTDISVFWVRMIAVLAFLLTGIWPVVILYFVAGLLMPLEPVVPFGSEADEEFYNSYANSRRMAVHRLKRTYDSLERRIRRMEDIVTARDYDWKRRLEE